MLKFKSILVIFVGTFFAIFLVSFMASIALYYYAITGLFFLLIISYGSFNIKAGFFLKTHCSGESDKKEISLTFDDGPNPDLTPLVLDILKETKVKATFFLIGNQIAGHESLVKRIFIEGHTIGLHSFTHSFFFGFFSSGRVKAELLQSSQLIYAIIGQKPRIFRPPFGVTNPIIAKVVKNLDYDLLGWSIRSLDTIIKKQDRLLKSLKKQLKPGSIILFHDTARVKVDILAEFINYLNEENYQVVSLEKLLSVKAYE